jgi:hypothetical protein
MNAHEVLWFERHGRRYFCPARDPHLRPDPFLRHDAHLFLPPQLRASASNADRSLERTCPLEEDEQSREAAFNRRALSELKSAIAKIQYDLAFERFKRAFLRGAYAEQPRGKAGFHPNQPRVPAGNSDGGQWTHDGGDGNDVSQDARVTLAALKLPRVPNNRPPTPQERNRTARELARWGLEAIVGAIAGGATWLNEQWASIDSYFDPPMTLEELQQAASDPRPGYDIHHIVERASAAEDDFERHLIDAPENLVRIPRWKHWAINSWYQTKNEAYGFLSPREYLRGNSWDVRMRVGHDALIDVGVLKR